ncbi:hypothetical protein EV426DRAFT_347872 [Tirmania nivea]|nr:hypothetical protein EV426DRAFT_347872 [Tirmania nivea]
MAPEKKKSLGIWFIHPDLGIGGAERLVVDAAVGLQQLGHSVTIFTSHCDERHCFDEVKDGTLAVHVRGNTLIPPHLFHRLFILCAILRQLHLTLSLSSDPPPDPSTPTSLPPTDPLYPRLPSPDVIFIDQLSASIPLLRLLYPATKILFYCHFPDKLLSPRNHPLAHLYRLPFDFLEGYSTSKSHSLLVNSLFTRSIFAQSFTGIASTPRVVYPCVDTSPPPTTLRIQLPTHKHLSSPNLLLSINRFERKKNIALAIHSFSLLPRTLRHASSTRLILAGGYDPRNAENAQYHLDLTKLCDTLGLQHATCKNYISALSLPDSVDVIFLLSIPASLKAELLSKARLLLYTPSNEHFGIVPLEAMLARTLVLAVNSGGPLETVVEGETGWLRPPDEKKWSAVMKKVLFEMSESEIRIMGEKARERVGREFSKEKMAASLQEVMYEMLEKDMGEPLFGLGELGVLVGVVMGLVAMGVWWFL